MWLPGVKPDYATGEAIFSKTAAVFAVLHWMRAPMAAGHDVCIITGRPASHALWIRQWCQSFLGQEVGVSAVTYGIVGRRAFRVAS